MEIKAKHAYPHGVETVFQNFGDKAKIENKLTTLHARNVKVETCKLTKTSLDILVTRESPIEAPALLKKFIGEWNFVTQEEHWKGSASKGYEGDIRVEIKGVPVTITGKFILSGDANNCTNDVSLKFECNIPLIGGKLADFVANLSKGQMQQEYEHIRDNC